MIRLSQTVLDCPDPLRLATFYSALTGLEIEAFDDLSPEEVTGVDLMNDGQPTLRFQRVENYQAPVWPEGPRPQQLHIDFAVDDLKEEERHALSLGATLAAFQPGERFRVFLDPVGHPFCLFKPGSE
jgi:predicted enzyme related to lactoylglutathione lyase